jgi:hypothetical protein
MRFRPRRNVRVLLGPVRDGCLAAPTEQLWHRLTMRALRAVGIHRRIVLPNGDGPENVSRFPHQGAAKETRRAFRLQRTSRRLNDKLRQIDQRSNPQSSHRYEGHLFLRACAEDTGEWRSRKPPPDRKNEVFRVRRTALPPVPGTGYSRSPHRSVALAPRALLSGHLYNDIQRHAKRRTVRDSPKVPVRRYGRAIFGGVPHRYSLLGESSAKTGHTKRAQRSLSR